jgi:hypothetical protein
MDTPIGFPDPRAAIRDLLRDLLAKRDDDYVAGVTVSVKDPPQADEVPVSPYIQIISDGRYRDSRLNGRATIRVLVWHSDDGLGERLASLCEGLLLAASSRDIRSISPLVGPIPTGDPDTGLPMSYFTITARLRPINL